MIRPDLAPGWRLAGTHYGYPRCCIESFVKDAAAETKRAWPTAPWRGTGFFPCMACAPQAAVDFPAWIAAHVIPYRLDPQPFNFLSQS